jgi:NitT/TauT family transport system substrate-binding protein
MKNSILRGVLLAVALIVGLAVLRAKPWRNASGGDPAPSLSGISTSPSSSGAGKGTRETLAVGFLPVTCHLTCPVTDFATRTSSRTRFVSQRFTDFPTVVETLKSGRMDATFMIAPLAMKIREQGLPVKIVYLGHRDGSTVMVRSDLPAKSLRDLKGKTFAIPSKFSNQNFVIHKLMERQGLRPQDFNFVEMPPPDMPGALAAKAIDAYFIGEPHAAKAELDKSGRVLYHAKDIWPDFISCVLVVTERLIQKNPAVVADLVRGIAESGEWAEHNRLQAAKIAAPMFRQKEELLRYVLTQPVDRVSYVMLTPTDKELGEIQSMGRKLGLLTGDMPISEIVDRRFIPQNIKPADIKPDPAKPRAS